MAQHQLNIRLHPNQTIIWNSKARFKVVAAGRRFGKTYMAAAMLAQETLRDYNERGYKLTQEFSSYYVAPTFEQAKRIIWPKLRELLGFEKTGGFIRNENVNDGWMELINSRRIYIRGADNPDSLRGIAPGFLIMDEYADMKAFVWSEIIEPAMMDVEAGAMFIGTPKGKNHFYKLFLAAQEMEDWEAFHFKSTDNPFLKTKELERMMNSDNRPIEIIRQELHASFIAGGSKVLKSDNFPIIPYADPGAGSVYITVDLAGFKKQEGSKLLRTDESVICATLVREDQWTVLNMDHGHWDVRETCARIVRGASAYPGCRLGIESGALMNACGPYLEEYMRTYSRYITPEGLTHGNNKKTDRIMWGLQGRSERGRISLVDDKNSRTGAWNDWFLSQAVDFPDPLSHDDGLDALAYVDQMAQANFMDASDSADYWEPEDMVSGY